MEESKLPKSLNEVSVQLIFSDGGESVVGAENVWQFYTIALLPFSLGVPPTQVTLFLAEGYLACTDEDLEGAARTCRGVNNFIPGANPSRGRNEGNTRP